MVLGDPRRDCPRGRGLRNDPRDDREVGVPPRDLGPKAASGDATAAAEMPQLGARIRRFGYSQITIGALILLAMVTARFS
jgi:hypothetical protein